MSRGLTLVISDATYDALQQQAALVGSDPECVAAVTLEHQFGKKSGLRYRGRTASCRRTL